MYGVVFANIPQLFELSLRSLVLTVLNFYRRLTRGIVWKLFVLDIVMCSLVVRFAKNAFVYVRQISLESANSKERFADTNKYVAPRWHGHYKEK